MLCLVEHKPSLKHIQASQKERKGHTSIAYLVNSSKLEFIVANNVLESHVALNVLCIEKMPATFTGHADNNLDITTAITICCQITVMCWNVCHINHSPNVMKTRPERFVLKSFQ